MKKLGKRQTCSSALQSNRWPRACKRAWGTRRLGPPRSMDGKMLRYIFDANEAERTGIPSLLRKLGRGTASASRIWKPASRASRISLSIWSSTGRRRRHEHPRHMGDLSLRNGPRAAHAVAEPGYPGASPPRLYFVVFGGAIGSRMQQVGGVGYGSFIVPGLIMLSLLTQSISNASIGIYFPQVHRHRCTNCFPRPYRRWKW